VGFKPNKVVDPISIGKAGHHLALVFPNAFHEIGGHSDVQSPLGFAGEEIDVKHAPNVLRFLN
jgi:hypothetical protein